MPGAFDVVFLSGCLFWMVWDALKYLERGIVEKDSGE